MRVCSLQLIDEHVTGLNEMKYIFWNVDGRAWTFSDFPEISPKSVRQRRSHRFEFCKVPYPGREGARNQRL
jgi:hypothetical protein